MTDQANAVPTDTSSSPLMPGGSVTSDDMKKRIGTGAASLLIVNAYALALEQTSLRAPTDPPPTWFDGLNANLETARGHAKNWLSIAEDIGSVIPTSVIEYGSEFQAAATLILKEIDTATDPQNPPGSLGYENAINAIKTYLGALQTKVEGISINVEGVATKLAQAQSDAATDFNAFKEGIGSIQGAEAHLETLIADINVDIKTLQDKIDVENKLLTASVLALGFGLLILVAGIALTVATGGAAAGLVIAGGAVATAGGIAGITATEVLMKKQAKEIAQKTQDLADDERQIVVLQGLDTTIEALKTNNTAAQIAMTAIGTQWKTIGKTLGDIIVDLDKTLTHPKDNSLKDILHPLAIATAANEWGALVNLVTGFQNAQQNAQTKTVEIVPDQQAA